MQRLNLRATLTLRLQKLWGFLALLPFHLIISLILSSVYRYRIANLRGIRKQYQKICAENPHVLICANHLTMIDSVLLHWAFAGPFWYLFHFNRFSWNLPAIENFGSTIPLRLTTYLSKCIPINRSGGTDHYDEVLSKVIWLMQRNEYCMIFPEGTRSRSGRIEPEKVTYGISKIISQVPECMVLCVYLRGNQQVSFSYLPEKNSEFIVKMDLFRPMTTETGRRAQRDLAQQVITRLKHLEDAYFAEQ